uniref:NPH3 domain-containing protein n=1 Tax=Oryza meridionalis TaxID=40149 RepID=A0A0E0E8F6_9ORYZ
MTEEHAEDNLTARVEAYLEQAVLRHPCEATKALKSREELLPHAEELGISCLVSYARGTIPGLSRSMRRRLASAPASSEVEQRDLLEAVVTSVPTVDKCSGRVVTAKFLFALLWTAHILLALDAACVNTALGRKAATQLEHATLEDVLIPSYSGGTETLYDVDCVERVVRHVLAEEEHSEAGESTSAAAITEGKRGGGCGRAAGAGASDGGEPVGAMECQRGGGGGAGGSPVIRLGGLRRARSHGGAR